MGQSDGAARCPFKGESEHAELLGLPLAAGAWHSARLSVNLRARLTELLRAVDLPELITFDGGRPQDDLGWRCVFSSLYGPAPEHMALLLLQRV